MGASLANTVRDGGHLAAFHFVIFLSITMVASAFFLTWASVVRSRIYVT
jgi:hypothetical protein